MARLGEAAIWSIVTQESGKPRTLKFIIFFSYGKSNEPTGFKLGSSD